LSFNRLQVLDTSRHARSWVRLGQAVIIDAIYTVKNLRAGRILAGTITRTYYTLTNGRFQWADQSTDDLTVARSGTYHEKHSIGGGFQRRTTVRIVAKIKLGKLSRLRQVTVDVR
jgi:hypothetical protein